MRHDTIICNIEVGNKTIVSLEDKNFDELKGLFYSNIKKLNGLKVDSTEYCQVYNENKLILDKVNRINRG